jgi:hypothetical protein
MEGKRAVEQGWLTLMILHYEEPDSNDVQNRSPCLYFDWEESLEVADSALA